MIYTSDSIAEGIENALTAGINAALGFVAITWIFGIVIILGIAALITLVVKAIWNTPQRKRKKHREYQESDYWYNNAHKRQQRIYEYTDPPLKHRTTKAESKATYTSKQGKWSPTGWIFNEETQLWEAPDYYREEANRRWRWDEEKRIWIDQDKKKARKTIELSEKEKELAKRVKIERKEPSYEEWKAAKQKEKKENPRD